MSDQFDLPATLTQQTEEEGTLPAIGADHITLPSPWNKKASINDIKDRPAGSEEFVQLEQVRKATLLQRFCWITISLQVILVVVSVGGALLNGDQLPPLPSLISGAVGIGFAFGCYRLSLRGYHRLGSWMLILSELIPFALVYAVVGTSVPFIIVFLLPIVIGMVLLTIPEVLIIGGGCLCFSLGLHILQDFLKIYQPVPMPFTSSGSGSSTEDFARYTTTFIELLFIPSSAFLLLSSISWQRRTLLAQNYNLQQALQELALRQNTSGQVSQQVLALATQLSSSAKQQSAHIHQQLSTITQIDTSLTELSETAINISELANQVDQVASLVSENNSIIEQTVGEGVIQAEQGLTKVEQTIKVSHEVSSLYQKLTATMHELSTKSTSMRRILDLLSSLSAETHLLSLNAAIEAAGAAEYGERFGVVAQEIKRLAGRSAKAGEEVVEIIKQIQDATELAQQVAQTGELKSQELTIVAQQTGQLFNQMQGVTRQCKVQALSTSEVSYEVKQLTEIIRAATTQQRSANIQVLEALQGLSLSAVQNTEGSSMVAATAGNLQTLSHYLLNSE